MAKKKKREYHKTRQIFSINNLEIPYRLLGNIGLLKEDEKIKLDGMLGYSSYTQDQASIDVLIERLKNMGDYLFPSSAILRFPFRNIGFYIRRAGDIYSAHLKVGSISEDVYEGIQKQLKRNVDFRENGLTVEYDGTDGCIFDEEGIAYIIASGDDEFEKQIVMGSGGAYTRSFPDYNIESPDSGEKFFEREIRGLENIANMILSGCYRGAGMVPFKKPVILNPV